jgi:hypothetical protein
MDTENIKKLKSMLNNRESDTGYMVNKETVRINKEKLRYITRSEYYDNFLFDPFILKAILEKEHELIERAYELEELQFREIEKKAKIEAANILAGTDLLNAL